MSAGAADRDTGLRRVSRMTRWLVAGSVAAAGVLSAVVAQALPGSSGSAATPTPGPGTVGAAPATPSPAVSPSPTSPPVTSDPTLQPAPPPVPTRHHSVARSGGS